MQAARQLIQEKGFHGMSMDELAERAGVSKPTLYQHFRTKEDIFVDAMLESMRQLEHFMLSLREGTPLQRLERILRDQIERQQRDGLLHSSMFKTNEMLRQHLELWSVYQRTAGMLHALVQEGKIQGEIDEHLHNYAIIGGLFTLLAFVEDEDYQRLSPEEQAQVVESIVQMYVRGIRKPNDHGLE